MNRWHNYYLDGHPHSITATIVDWRPVFDDRAIDIIYREWDTARKTLAVKVLAYVVMPEHIHIVVWAELGDNIRRFLQRTLSLTSRSIEPDKGRLWKERPRVLPIYSSSVLKTKVDYFHRNPIKRGLVENPEDWPHSSYRQLVMGASDAGFLCDDWEGISI